MHYYPVFYAYTLKKGGEITVRFRLWHDALYFISQSPVVGYGPGNYLNADIAGTLGNYEAHNTFLNLALQTGIVGISIVCFFTIKLARLCRHDYLLLGMICSLLVFGCFHFVLRQPIYWISWYVIYYLKTNNTNSNR